MRRRSTQVNSFVETRDNADIVQKQRTALACIVRYLKEYCRYSGIHGFRYLSEEGRSRFEKLFWAIAIAISTIGCAMMIAKIKTKMNTAPIIVTLAENPTKIWHIPFPAITICPDWVSRLTAFNFTKYATLMSRNDKFLDDFLKWVKESKIGKRAHNYQTNYTFQFPANDVDFNDTSLFGNATQRHILYKKLWALHALRGGLQAVRAYPGGNATLALDDDDVEFVVEVAPNILSGIDYSKELRNFMLWRTKFMYLEHHFKHLWTEMGVCFTFNLMDDINMYREKVVNNEVFKRKGLDSNFPKPSNDWDPDKGYSYNLSHQTYPWRFPFERRIPSKMMRIVTTHNPEDVDKFWTKDTLNYMMIFHQPQDHPQANLHSLVKVPVYKLFDIAIKMHVMVTSPELEKYDPHVRGCFYSHEKRLEYFKFYSQNNCHLECLANMSLKLCGCVSLFMPRYNTSKICGGDAYKCVSRASLHADKDEFDESLKHVSENGESPFHSTDTEVQCDCLPNCLSIEYEADVRGTEEFASLSSLKFSDYPSPVSEETLTLSGADIIVRKRSFIAHKRSEYYGELDFLANSGGLFGLFCGFSILSFVEILYFLTIRLCTNIYQYLAARPLPALPGGLPEEEGPPRNLVFNIPPPVDQPLRSVNLITCVCEKEPARAQKWEDIRGTPGRAQHWTEEILWHDYRR